MARIHQALFAALDQPLTVWIRQPGGSVGLADLNPAAARILGLDRAAIGRAPSELGRGPLWSAMVQALDDRQPQDVLLAGATWCLRPLALGEGAVAVCLQPDSARGRVAAGAELTHLVSHDLQEPLRIVSMYGQLLERRLGDALDDTSRSHLDTMLAAIHRMYRLIDDLVALSAVDEAPLREDRVDLQALVGDVIARLGPDARDARVRAVGLPAVVGTEALYRQLLERLLDNAIRYRSDARPVVELTARREADRWRITVADNGVGVDPAFAGRIFEPFRRLHTYEEHPGTGMGLAICRRIVERHGGEIAMESEPGRGSRFHVTLPSASDP